MQSISVIEGRRARPRGLRGAPLDRARQSLVDFFFYSSSTDVAPIMYGGAIRACAEVLRLDNI